MFNNLESAGSQITMLQMLASSIDTANSVDNTPVMDEKGTDITPQDTTSSLIKWIFPIQLERF